MLIEYVSNAWRNAKKDRKRFITILCSVALSTFCVLILYALTITSSKHIEFLSESLYAQNQNNQLFFISSNKERDLGEFLSLLKEEKVISGGYTYQMYITDHPFEPWIEYGDDIVMQTDPIFIDPEEAASQGFKQKVIMGDYLSSENEIVLSESHINFFEKRKSLSGRIPYRI